jgi:hypothetical protein
MVYYYLSIYKQVTLVKDLVEKEPERSSKLIERLEDAFKNYKVKYTIIQKLIINICITFCILKVAI